MRASCVWTAIHSALMLRAIMRGIQVTRTGGPETLVYAELPDPQPKRGQVSIRVEASGVNFIDVYHRTGLYSLPLPFVPGLEGAGVIEAIGEDVRELSTGDRVAWATGAGSYAERVVVDADKLVLLPPQVDAQQGAAAMLQGLTAHFLVTDSHRIQPGQTALIHAAAGGVGRLLVQLAKQRGARVLATASTRKLDIAKEAGADVVIDYTREDFEAVVNRETGGRGVDVAYDSVGLTTFDKSMSSVAVRGSLVLFGQSSGVVPPVSPGRFADRAIFFSRPRLFHFVRTREELRARADELFDSIARGALTLRIDRTLPLRDAAEAHRILESRDSAGKILLQP